jgi:farnesyl diphosphate synthase
VTPYRAHAFQLLSSLEIDASMRIDLIQELSFSAGTHGMCGGQAIDLASVGRFLT